MIKIEKEMCVLCKRHNMENAGIEPATLWVQIIRSANWANPPKIAQISHVWTRHHHIHIPYIAMSHIPHKHNIYFSSTSTVSLLLSYTTYHIDRSINYSTCFSSWLFGQFIIIWLSNSVQAVLTSVSYFTSIHHLWSLVVRCSQTSCILSMSSLIVFSKMVNSIVMPSC
jgi:hypothetical protein